MIDSFIHSFINGGAESGSVRFDSDEGTDSLVVVVMVFLLGKLDLRPSYGIASISVSRTVKLE